MRINDNGVIREMSAEEIAEYERMVAEMPASERTTEERIAALEEENAHLIEALNLLLEGVTDDG